jgi:ATP:ADP antiporter, AAA family
MSGSWGRVSSFLKLSKEETKKIVWLALAFFCVIGGYTILKEMKDSLFVTLSGVDSMFMAKIISLCALIPATLLYAKLVDSVSRYKLLWIYTTVYAVGGLIIALLLNTSSVGLLSNEITMSRKVFGWFIYLFYEGANPFVVSLFWSFSNSITSPGSAKRGYAVMTSGAKLGGMTTAGIAWVLFNFSGAHAWVSDVWVYQFLLAGASLLLWCAPYIIYKLRKGSSEQSLHGYEAAYQVDHKKEEKGERKTGILSGLWMMKKHSYIFGIFGMIFFYELINVVLGVQRLVIMEGAAKSLSGFSGSLFGQRFLMHSLGFAISFFGTRPLINKLGERVCLLLIPIIMSTLLLIFMLFYNEQAVLIVFMLIGTLNYAFASPLRESLYIPTVRDIRFKSKAWIDSFGTKFSKGCGALIIGVVQYFAVTGSPLFMSLYSAIFASISGLWILLAYFLGKKYDDLVKNNKVVGSED